MAETNSASDKNSDVPAEPVCAGSHTPLSSGTCFARSGKAFTGLALAVLELARALRADGENGSRAAVRRLRIVLHDSLRMRLSAHDVQIPNSGGALVPKDAAAQASKGHNSSAATAAPKPIWVARVGRRKLLLRGAAAICSAFLLLAAGILVWTLSDVPWDEIADGALEPVVVLETSDGRPLLRQGPMQGPYAVRADFPPHLIDAVLTAEDRRFYQHAGIDRRAISRALLRNFGAGEVIEGGSTITQQLIKILYLERERTLKRKIQEAVIAIWLERKLGKDEILTRYLNNIYLGAGATGVPAAARIYFDKDVGELNVAESAMLAGIIRAPSQLSPATNSEGARRQAGIVLNSMLETGKISDAQAKAATARFAQLGRRKTATRSGSWFADWVMQEARELAGPYRGTIRVRTTIVPRLQAMAEQVVAAELDRAGKQAGVSQAALVAMTPEGAVLAMAGGRDYAKSTFNRAVSAMRQPGSTFKLFVLYAALKAGWSPIDEVEDAPIKVGDWSPENHDGTYNGNVSIAEAFARSLNAASVALAMDVGIDKVVAAARELGIDAPLAETPSLALGTSEVNLLDLTGAYASVRAGKAPVEPWGIMSFHADGQPNFRVGPNEQGGSDLREHQRDLVRLLRLAVVRGTGKEADPGTFAAGKTGTSQNYRDAWFVGFTDALVVGVWVGNDDGTPMAKVTGGELPARIWRKFMTAALAAPEDPSGTEEVGARYQRGSPRLCVQLPQMRAGIPLLPPLRLHLSALWWPKEAVRKISFAMNRSGKCRARPSDATALSVGFFPRGLAIGWRRLVTCRPVIKPDAAISRVAGAGRECPLGRADGLTAANATCRFWRM